MSVGSYGRVTLYAPGSITAELLCLGLCVVMMAITNRRRRQ